MNRVGLGWDIHPLAAGEGIVLGGIEIPCGFSLVGHSDADVLLHAISDAILGAAGLPDIGTLFPASDPSLKGIASSLLLARALEKVRAAGWTLVNIDSVVIAQAPTLAPFIARAAHNIAFLTSLDPDSISVKAKSPEGLGPLGHSQGIAAQAIALIEKLETIPHSET